MMPSAKVYFKRRSLAFIVLITGIVGGLLIVFSILLLCKYCLNRKNLRETEQMKLLYETLNQTPVLDAKNIYQTGTREFSRLEPRRSNPLDRYQLPEDQWQIPSSKPVPSDYHVPGVQGAYNQPYHESREQAGNKPHDPHVYRKTSTDDEPGEQYLQVDPRCYVRQNSNVLATSHSKKSETPRLEKGLSLNVDTRRTPTSSLSPYRQSSFDVTLAYNSPNQLSPTPSPSVSTQQEIYFTPRGSSLSVVGNTPTNTPPGSQHLSIPTPVQSRKNSDIEKKEMTAELDLSKRTSTIRSSIVQREHEHSRSLEQTPPTNNSTIDKQSRSFDAVHLLRPVIHRSDAVVNRRTKSYENAEGHQEPPSTPPPTAPPPIIIKIPDMSKLVQAAHLQNNGTMTSHDLWCFRQSYEREQQQQQLDRTSPEDLSPDLLTSTSIDSAGAMANDNTNKANTGDGDDESSRYQHRRKSSSNLLVPPPEVRRQALRRTFEKRRSCINQSNARREQQLLNNQTNVDDDYTASSTLKSTEFSSLLNNFNSKSENSSFDRSLETDFDMQSDTSSRGLNDHFTSIESSGNENALPDVNHGLLPVQQQSSPHHDDSGYKSLESQNQTFSLDWMSADGGESVIYMGESRIQQRSVDLKDVEEDSTEQQISNNNRYSPTSHIPNLSKSNKMQQRSLSTNIPLDDRNAVNHLLSPNTNIVTSSSFNRSASKRRREFGKDKRHASSSIGLPYLKTDEHQFSSQINEVNTKQTSSTLHVRHPDIRRSKSDEAEILDTSRKEFVSHSDKSNNNNHLSYSADVIRPSTPLSNPVQVGNTGSYRRIFQRSPSSTTPPVAMNPLIVAFRSTRGSISFDNQSPLINPPNSNTTKPSPSYSVLSTSAIKPRLKFSMVRDSTTASLGSSSAPSYSMPLTADYTLDEKTNRIINEFLMQDDNNNNMNNEVSYQEPQKRHHQPIRQKTFDETMMTNNDNKQKQSRLAFIKQRQHSYVQPTTRPRILPHYPSIHIPNSAEHDEDKNYSPSAYIQQSIPIIRRDNGVAAGSPSIIVTGYDSSS